MDVLKINYAHFFFIFHHHFICCTKTLHQYFFLLSTSSSFPSQCTLTPKHTEAPSFWLSVGEILCVCVGVVVRACEIVFVWVCVWERVCLLTMERIIWCSQPKKWVCCLRVLVCEQRVRNQTNAQERKKTLILLNIHWKREKTFISERESSAELLLMFFVILHFFILFAVWYYDSQILLHILNSSVSRVLLFTWNVNIKKSHIFHFAYYLCASFSQSNKHYVYHNTHKIMLMASIFSVSHWIIL